VEPTAVTHGEDAGQEGYNGIFVGDVGGVKLVDPSPFLVELTLLNDVHVVFNSGGCPCTDVAPFFEVVPVIDLYVRQPILPSSVGANDQPWILMFGGSSLLTRFAKSQHCAALV
jgi:hypothetical protein